MEKIFTSYDIQACLYDEVRVGYFRDAIEKTVREGDIVVDAGSGTGLLGMLAVRAGAAKVFCVEINKEYVEVIRENARRNGMEDQIVPMHGDATTIALPEQVDVIVSEVISAGFFYEPQLQILNNLRRQLKTGGAIIPLAMDNRIELINAQDELYGLKFNYDTRFKSMNDVALTTKATYLQTDFAQGSEHFITANTRVRASASGRVNAARISYGIEFARGIASDQPTDFLLNPQIIFLREPISVIAGEDIDISLSYEASTSPLDCKIQIKQSSVQLPVL
jgi:predicted RNA methylase